MLSISKTQPTTIRVAFTTSNLTPVGYSADMKINGVTYTVSPVADGFVASVSVPANAASAIATSCFIAEVNVYNAASKLVLRLRQSGAVVNRELTEVEKSNNVIPALLMPEFKVPDGKIKLSLPVTATKIVDGVPVKYSIDVADDEAGTDFTIERK